MAKIMAVNAGSSSLKFKLYEMPSEEVITSGIAERIGHDDAIFTIKYQNEKDTKILPIKNHSVAVDLLLKALIEKEIVKDIHEIKALGHRIVQGGKYFSQSVIVNEDVVNKVRSLIPLAPLHNEAHLIGYQAFKDALPESLNVFTFDTAFHQTMAEEDYLFPIPYELSIKYDCRRYGAHGTSHKYLAHEGQKYLKKGSLNRIISCHIGSGASLSAIKNEKCLATSMGLTPLGGVMMGTRTGDLDPSVMDYLCRMENKSVSEMYQIFNKQSGFLGVSGVSNDSRDIIDAVNQGNPRAIIADKLFIRRILDYIGQYYVRLGGVDLIIFSAGIGENASYYRQKICEALKDSLSVIIDNNKNEEMIRGKEGLISTNESKVQVAVIPTDEEIMIARDTYAYFANKNIE